MIRFALGLACVFAVVALVIPTSAIAQSAHGSGPTKFSVDASADSTSIRLRSSPGTLTRIPRPYQPSPSGNGDGPTRFEVQGTGTSANTYRTIYLPRRYRGYYPYHGRYGYDEYYHYRSDYSPGYAGRYDRYKNPSQSGRGTAVVIDERPRDDEAEDAAKDQQPDRGGIGRALPPVVAKRHAAKGWALLSAGEIEKAKAEFELAMNDVGNDGLARIGAALAAGSEGDLTRASGLMRQAVSNDPRGLQDLPVDQPIRALIERLSERYAQSLEINPDDLDSAFMMASLAVIVEKTDDASRAIAIVVESGDTNKSTRHLVKMLSDKK